ncbi:ATP-binding protein [Actinomadura sp. KC216]|uniref:ATP-binding protein n=1 Tax=Actinomadura sp. KC216 TaxID=2530370 RepID=UPI0010433BBC|nr:ATP-binding protein [Actinomadura sp. KC216]TDB71843.1 ATP-binding protein [Actinomadura sp. KC216]
MTTTGTGTRRPATTAADHGTDAGGDSGAPRRTGGTDRPDDETEPMNTQDTAADDDSGSAADNDPGSAADNDSGGADDSTVGGAVGARGHGTGGAVFAAWDLAAEPAAASRARGLTRRALREWHVTDPGDVDDIVLIVDELVTNAVVHGAGPVRLALRLRGDRLDGEVRDAAPTDHPGRHGTPGPLTGAAPAEPRVLDWAEAGRGLLLVAALATRYGARPEPPGKTVWFARHLTAAGDENRPA